MNQPVRIMVCEDDPDHRMLMMDALEDALPEAAFQEVESGEECLAALAESLPEVLVLDYRLGDMDALELLDEMGDMIQKTAVLLVTSQGDERIAVDAMKRGVRDYIVKDTRMVFLDHLPIAVRNALNQIRAEREREAAQEKLAASERLSRTILDRMMEAVIYADASGRIRHVNELACKLLDMDWETAVNSYLTDEPVARKLPRIETFLEQLKRRTDLPVIEEEQTFGDEILFVRFSPVREDSEYRGVIVNLMNITDRRRHEIERLEAINRTVSALAKAVELRDPYTSGHAAGVALIAVRIAERLGWDEQRIMGLKLAGELHDIGKIAIPAEILTRPTELSPLEKAMLREHPQKGFEILKDIKFPFPVAEAVYQHHEALDGSGYPRGIRGDEIIEEARVLAVADVLEAITAHRPYRAGLGIDRALEYLIGGKGRLFDPKIVDAAVRLVKEAGGVPFWQATGNPAPVGKRRIKSRRLGAEKDS